MPGKDRLASLLSDQPGIRRGQGVRLSTDIQQSADAGASAHVSAQERSHVRSNAKSHKRITAIAHTSKRVNRGYMLREDLIKELKLIAVNEDRNLYEVMEEALEQFLKGRI